MKYIHVVVESFLYLEDMTNRIQDIVKLGVIEVIDVVSSNTAHGEVNSLQHYVIKFGSDLRQIGGFLRVLSFHLPIKLTVTYNSNIVESCGQKYNPNPIM